MHFLNFKTIDYKSTIELTDFQLKKITITLLLHIIFDLSEMSDLFMEGNNKNLVFFSIKGKSNKMRSYLGYPLYYT